MKINLKENELVLKASDIKLLDDDNEIKMKLILTNQQRLYFVNSGEHDFEINKNEIVEITYFNKNIFNKNGVHIITTNDEYEFYIKKRKKWELLFSKLY